MHTQKGTIILAEPSLQPIYLLLERLRGEKVWDQLWALTSKIER